MESGKKNRAHGKTGCAHVPQQATSHWKREQPLQTRRCPTPTVLPFGSARPAPSSGPRSKPGFHEPGETACQKAEAPQCPRGRLRGFRLSSECNLTLTTHLKDTTPAITAILVSMLVCRQECPLKKSHSLSKKESMTACSLAQILVCN